MHVRVLCYVACNDSSFLSVHELEVLLVARSCPLGLREEALSEAG